MFFENVQSSCPKCNNILKNDLFFLICLFQFARLCTLQMKIMYVLEVVSFAAWFSIFGMLEIVKKGQCSLVSQSRSNKKRGGELAVLLSPPPLDIYHTNELTLQHGPSRAFSST